MKLVSLPPEHTTCPSRVEVSPPLCHSPSHPQSHTGALARTQTEGGSGLCPTQPTEGGWLVATERRREVLSGKPKSTGHSCSSPCLSSQTPTMLGSDADDNGEDPILGGRPKDTSPQPPGVLVCMYEGPRIKAVTPSRPPSSLASPLFQAPRPLNLPRLPPALPMACLPVCLALWLPPLGPPL